MIVRQHGRHSISTDFTVDVVVLDLDLRRSVQRHSAALAMYVSQASPLGVRRVRIGLYRTMTKRNSPILFYMDVLTSHNLDVNSGCNAFRKKLNAIHAPNVRTHTVQHNKFRTCYVSNKIRMTSW